MADFMDDADDILLAATPTKTTGKTKHGKAKVPTKPKMVVTAKKLAKAKTKKTSKSNDTHTPDIANMERWLRKQKREYLIGLQSDME